MTTKNILFALFFLTFMGCNTDSDINRKEELQSPVVRFGGKITQILPSKAIINEEVLPDHSQVGIYAWGHHKNDGEVNTQIREDLNNAIYTKIAGTDELSAGADAHYPINPDTLLNIYAYYPYTAAANDSPLRIPFDLNQQEDVMWATPILNQSKSAENPLITLTFNHILSAITLKFKKADDIKEEMILESISMENYDPTVFLNIQEGKLFQPASKAAFTMIRDLQIPVTSAEQTVLTDFMLCPVEKPVFIVRISGKDYRIESAKPFMGGKKQTYEFTIMAKDIVVSGSITPWGDGGTSNEIVYF